MFNSVVQANIPVWTCIDTQCLSLPFSKLYINFCSFVLKIVQEADCFWCYEDTDTKSCNLSVSTCQKSNTFVTHTNSNGPDFATKRFALLDHAHSFQSITCTLSSLPK